MSGCARRQMIRLPTANRAGVRNWATAPFRRLCSEGSSAQYSLCAASALLLLLLPTSCSSEFTATSGSGGSTSSASNGLGGGTVAAGGGSGGSAGGSPVVSTGGTTLGGSGATNSGSGGVSNSGGTPSTGTPQLIRLDLQGPDGVLQEGWVAAPVVAYSDGAAFGWDNPIGVQTIFSSGAAGVPNSLNEDAHYGVAPRAFRIAVPNGTYCVGIGLDGGTSGNAGLEQIDKVDQHGRHPSLR